MKSKFLYSIVARLLIACIFATGVAFSDSLKSAIQYGAELEKKHSSIVSIKEDTDSIENALKNKIGRARGRIEGRNADLDHRVLSVNDISSIIPASPQPGFNIRAIPNGTLSPQGNTGIINRGISKKGEN